MALLARYKIPVPRAKVAQSVEEAYKIAGTFGRGATRRWQRGGEQPCVVLPAAPDPRALP